MNNLIVEPWVCDDSMFAENERQLRIVLQAVYPEIVRDDAISYSVVLPEYHLRERGDRGSPNIFVDAWVESKNLIVYVDTIEDYTDPVRMVHTQESDSRLKQMGYSVIHIPYFIQMSTEIVQHFFGKTVNISCSQSSGFVMDSEIHPNEYVPARYCSMGWNLFISQMYALPKDVFACVMESLKRHAERFGQELTTICFPLGLECKTCPVSKEKEDIKKLWETATKYPKSLLQ